MLVDCCVGAYQGVLGDGCAQGDGGGEVVFLGLGEGGGGSGGEGGDEEGVS